MSDLMVWLYTHYIKPQIDAAPQENYSFHLDLMQNETCPQMEENLEKCLEFTAIQAFLLGLRTGQGLPRY